MMEFHDPIDLPLQGRTVTRCPVDFAFSLQFWEMGESTINICIEGPFTLKHHAREWALDAEEDNEGLGKALTLFRKTVAQATAHQDGGLELRFTDGTELSVPPLDKYEAWQFGGAGWLIVSTPGGGLAIWGPTEAEKQ
ncbi:MAG TPA: DUF6188 family protein [Thermomicrobiales bacterium]|nr:DUF6188 family protein [Thermomicrobiales bacterium]